MITVNAATADVNILGEVVEDVIIDDNSPAVNTMGAEVDVVSADDDDNSLKINGKIV